MNVKENNSCFWQERETHKNRVEECKVHVKYSNICGVKNARYMWETNISLSYLQVYYVACVH
jgi:hypothetical protein